MAVRMDSKLLLPFLNKAKEAYPKEYIEVIFGRVRNGHVYFYMLVPVAHKASTRRLSVDEEEYEELQDEASSYGYELLGTIHSHPNSKTMDVSPSEQDWFDAVDTDEVVTGICAISSDRKKNKFPCRIAFWFPVLPCQIQLSR